MRLIVLFILVLCFCHCRTVDKSSQLQRSEVDSLATAHVSTQQMRMDRIDSAIHQERTDGSTIETEWERKVIAEDYFVPDSIGAAGTVIRKTTTYEKGTQREQKAVQEKTDLAVAADHSQIMAKDTSGQTVVKAKAETNTTAKKVKSPVLAVAAFVLSLLLLLLLLVYWQYRRLKNRVTLIP